MTTAVLLHGAYGAPGDWAEAAAGLDVPVLEPALDEQLPAAVLARLAPEEVSARVVDRLAVGLPPGPLLLGGYSLGARVALALAVRPEVAARTAGLLLVSGTAGLDAPDERRRRAAVDDERAAALEADPATFLRAFWALPLFAGLDGHPRREALLASRIERIARAPALHAALARGLSVARMAPLWARLGEVEADAVVLCGARDADYVRHGRRLAEGLPRGMLHVVEGAGHALLLEAPIDVGRALRHLSGIGPTPRTR